MIATRDAIKAVLSLTIAGVFMWSAFHSVDLPEVWDVLLRTNALWVFGGWLLVILATYPRAYRWRSLIYPVLPDVPITTLFRAILIGYAGNNLIPRAGEIAKILAVDRDPDKMSSLLATVAIERLIDLIVVIAMFAGVMFLIRDKLETAFPGMAQMVTSASILISLVAVALAILSVKGDRIADAVEPRATSPRLIKLISLGRAFLEGTKAVRTPGGYLSIFAWTFWLNAAYVGAIYLPFLGFGFTGKYGLDFVDAIVVTTISTLGIIIPTPGGAGTYHYFCSRALNGLYGIPLEEALAFATVVHGLIFFGFLLIGGPGLIALIWRKPKS